MKPLSPLVSWVTLRAAALILTSCGSKNDQAQSPPARQTVRVRQASGVGTAASQSLGYSGTVGTGVRRAAQLAARRHPHAIIHL
jgi:hypothetical protein